jgi:parallel beta-helix repeat protein
MRNLGMFILGCITPLVTFSQVNWYVSPSGLDAPGRGVSPTTAFKTITYACNSLTPGDTCFVLGGVYKNPSFDAHEVWNEEITANINNVDGLPGSYITFKPYQNEKPILKGDGTFMVRIRNSEYMRFEGFEIYGEVENIPMDSAIWYQFQYRQLGSNITEWRIPFGTPESEIDTFMHLPILNSPLRPSWTNTIGFLAQNSHHIDILNNYCHHLPGTGMRAFECDYINFIGNEVHDCSRRGAVGNHGVVFHSSKSIDNANHAKINISKNHVHHNYNEVYSWSEIKSFITTEIDEGKGLSMQKNDAIGWHHGIIRIENNLCHHNGFSGIHINDGVRFEIINNTCYENYWSGRGSNTGISVQSGADIKILNNISVSLNAFDGFAMSVSNSTGLEVKNNLVHGTIDQDVDAVDIATIFGDPLFMQPSSFLFALRTGSPALGNALASVAPTSDFYGTSRPLVPDRGAIEHQIGQCVPCIKVAPKVLLQGAYNTSTDLMTDNLRLAGLLPTSEPYTALGFSHIGNSGDESVHSSVFTTTGAIAIVDWVFIELRDKNAPSSKLFTRSALLQRDGDIVDMDGVSPVFFPTATEQDYYLVVRHRNHLGVRALTVSTLTQHAPLVNLTNNLATLYKPAGHPNEVATSFPNGKIGLWAGNANGDNSVKMTGAFPSSNDYLKLLNTLGSSTVVLSNIYSQQDLNMDGSVKMTGAFPNTNDYLRLLNVLGSSTNTIQQGY